MKIKQVVFRAPDLSPSFVEAMDYVVNSLLRVKEQDLLTHIAQVTKEVRHLIIQRWDLWSCVVFFGFYSGQSSCGENSHADGHRFKWK